MIPRLILPALVFALLSSGCASTPPSDGAPAAATLRERLAEAARTHVVVVVTARDRVTIDRRRVPPADLPEALAEVGRTSPGRPVALLLEPGSKAEAESFVRAQVAKAGLGAVDLVDPD